jgi:predicted phage terminase large subunit-like protein
MDTAYTRNQTSDYTVIATWGVVEGARDVDSDTVGPPALVLLEVKRVKVEHFEHQPLIQDVWERRRPAWVGIEKMTATLSLFAEAQRAGVVVRWLTPDKNKIARAETAAALAAAGRVWLPEDADWLSEWLEEVVTFPVAKHDDQVDTFSYAANELVHRTIRPRKVKHEPTSASDKMWEKLRQRDSRRPQHPTLGRWT